MSLVWVQGALKGFEEPWVGFRGLMCPGWVQGALSGFEGP